jgi:hypothetical protein
MKHLAARRAAWMTALLLLLGASPARADFMNWSYSWKLTAGPTFTSSNSNVSVALANGASQGAATLPAAAISASSASPTTDSFNASYGLSLSIKDNPSGNAGTLTWNGQISGTVGPGTSTLQNTFSAPLTESLTLAGHIYKVTLEPSPANIPAPNSNTRALIDAQVAVSDASTGGGGNTGGTGNTGGGTGKTGGGPGPQVSSTPEPSSLLLAGCALSLASAAGWRRRARAAATSRA